MAWYDDEEAAVPSDWFSQEESMQQPVSSDWWAQEEANAGPVVTSDWWAQEEANAGPEATPAELAASGYNTSAGNVSSGSSSPSLSGAVAALKSMGSGLLGKTQTPEGLMQLALMANLLKGYLDPKYGQAQPAGYKGGVNMNLKANTPQIAQAARAYGEGAQGQSYFGPTTYAAEGGIMDLATGGAASRAPRYLDGATDGMADEINTSIDDKQPAKLSHGEFVIPADVVSHLGNGNSSAGAKVLYSMMDKVRQARTGNKKQGKQISPAKFMPGGIAGYAEGGAVAFAAGDIVPPAAGTAVESNLASWAGPYVTDYLAKGKALADKPYQAYTGQLTADTSPLQQQAMTGLQSTPAYQPAEFGNQFAAPTAYQPTAFGNQFAAPTAYDATNFDTQFAAPTPYQAGTFTNQFTAPGAYQAGQFATGLGALGSVADYMSPYTQNVTDVQSAEARRQAEIARIASAGRMTQAGAFGGSRQAILDAENNRNLQTQLGGIQATGLQSAYDRALAQRLAESKAGVEAQQLGEQSRQFGAGQALNAAQLAAQYGMSAQQAAEASRQFGAGQTMTGAQEAARYRLADQQASEASRQFGAGQAMTGAQLGAQYGLAGLQASEAAKQFGAGQAMSGAQLGAQYGLAGQQATEASKQFGARQGLDLLGAQLGAGATQRSIEQQALDAQRAQFEAERADPYKQIQFQQSLIAGLPVGTQSSSANTSGMQDLAALIASMTGAATTKP